VFRVTEMEAALEKNFSPDAISKITIDQKKMLSDIHASPAYRANLVQVMARRAVAAIA
jgi:carbon-monoxide dehydrogenase medium subunit